LSVRGKSARTPRDGGGQSFPNFSKERLRMSAPQPRHAHTHVQGSISARFLHLIRRGEEARLSTFPGAHRGPLRLGPSVRALLNRDAPKARHYTTRPLRTTEDDQYSHELRRAGRTPREAGANIDHDERKVQYSPGAGRKPPAALCMRFSASSNRQARPARRTDPRAGQSSCPTDQPRWTRLLGGTIPGRGLPP
jgi:hypothetical protein